jgi:hypothetical protein
VEKLISSAPLFGPVHYLQSRSDVVFCRQSHWVLIKLANRFWCAVPYRITLACISGLRREEGENCAILCSYSASSGNFWSVFRDNLSVPSSGFKNSKKKPWEPKRWVVPNRQLEITTNRCIIIQKSVGLKSHFTLRLMFSDRSVATE